MRLSDYQLSGGVWWAVADGVAWGPFRYWSQARRHARAIGPGAITVMTSDEMHPIKTVAGRW